MSAESESLFDVLFSSGPVRAATSADAWLAALLRFERELAAAEAEVGIIPVAAARAIAVATDGLRPDMEAIEEGTRAAGNPVVPLVRELSRAVGQGKAGDGEVGEREAGDPGGPGYGAWVHFGATSQDAMDSAAMLVAQEAGRLILADVGAAADACADLAEVHRRTLMAGRTLLQQALPITFGLKAAGWLTGFTDAADRLADVLDERLAVQLGGAAGTLASLGDSGPAVSARLAARLGLADPPLPWHTERGRVTELAGALAGVANAGAKVALDVVLLAQTEVGEVTEGGGGGHGGSSTLPHKANPITSVAALAAARRAHAAAGTLVAAGVQDHERAGTGAWHVEWPALTDLLRAVAACADGARRVLSRLVVDPARMSDNLDRTGGVLLAERVTLDLSPELGRGRAATLVGAASQRALAEHTSLRQALGATAEIAGHRSPGDLDRLCRPEGYLGTADVLVARALTLHEAATRRRDGRRAGRRAEHGAAGGGDRP